MSAQPFTATVLVENSSWRKDGSLGVRFTTLEEVDEEYYLNVCGWVKKHATLYIGDTLPVPSAPPEGGEIPEGEHHAEGPALSYNEKRRTWWKDVFIRFEGGKPVEISDEPIEGGTRFVFFDPTKRSQGLRGSIVNCADAEGVAEERQEEYYQREMDETMDRYNERARRARRARE